jgi:hypothetical protein
LPDDAWGHGQEHGIEATSKGGKQKACVDELNGKELLTACLFSGPRILCNRQELKSSEVNEPYPFNLVYRQPGLKGAPVAARQCLLFWPQRKGTGESGSNC